MFLQVTDPKKLNLNYKRQTRFVADVIATIPLQYVANISIGRIKSSEHITKWIYLKSCIYSGDFYLS